MASYLQTPSPARGTSSHPPVPVLVDDGRLAQRPTTQDPFVALNANGQPEFVPLAHSFVVLPPGTPRPNWAIHGHQADKTGAVYPIGHDWVVDVTDPLHLWIRPASLTTSQPRPFDDRPSQPGSGPKVTIGAPGITPPPEVLQAALRILGNHVSRPLDLVIHGPDQPRWLTVLAESAAIKALPGDRFASGLYVGPPDQSAAFRAQALATLSGRPTDADAFRLAMGTTEPEEIESALADLTPEAKRLAFLDFSVIDPDLTVQRAREFANRFDVEVEMPAERQIAGLAARDGLQAPAHSVAVTANGHRTVTPYAHTFRVYPDSRPIPAPTLVGLAATDDPTVFEGPAGWLVYVFASQVVIAPPNAGVDFLTRMAERPYDPTRHRVSFGAPGVVAPAAVRDLADQIWHTLPAETREIEDLSSPTGEPDPLYSDDTQAGPAGVAVAFRGTRPVYLIGGDREPDEALAIADAIGDQAASLAIVNGSVDRFGTVSTPDGPVFFDDLVVRLASINGDGRLVVVFTGPGAATATVAGRPFAKETVEQTGATVIVPDQHAVSSSSGDILAGPPVSGRRRTPMWHAYTPAAPPARLGRDLRKASGVLRAILPATARPLSSVDEVVAEIRRLQAGRDLADPDLQVCLTLLEDFFNVAYPYGIRPAGTTDDMTVGGLRSQRPFGSLTGWATGLSKQEIEDNLTDERSSAFVLIERPGSDLNHTLLAYRIAGVVTWYELTDTADPASVETTQPALDELALGRVLTISGSAQIQPLTSGRAKAPDFLDGSVNKTFGAPGSRLLETGPKGAPVSGSAGASASATGRAGPSSVSRMIGGSTVKAYLVLADSIELQGLAAGRSAFGLYTRRPGQRSLAGGLSMYRVRVPVGRARRLDSGDVSGLDEDDVWMARRLGQDLLLPHDALGGVRIDKVYRPGTTLRKWRAFLLGRDLADVYRPVRPDGVDPRMVGRGFGLRRDETLAWFAMRARSLPQRELTRKELQGLLNKVTNHLGMPKVGMKTGRRIVVRGEFDRSSA